MILITIRDGVVTYAGTNDITETDIQIVVANFDDEDVYSHFTDLDKKFVEKKLDEINKLSQAHHA